MRKLSFIIGLCVFFLSCEKEKRKNNEQKKTEQFSIPSMSSIPPMPSKPSEKEKTKK